MKPITPPTAEERSRALQKVLDKIPWTAFAHGVLVEAIEQAERSAYERGFLEANKRVGNRAGVRDDKENLR